MLWSFLGVYWSISSTVITASCVDGFLHGIQITGRRPWSGTNCATRAAARGKLRSETIAEHVTWRPSIAIRRRGLDSLFRHAPSRQPSAPKWSQARLMPRARAEQDAARIRADLHAWTSRKCFPRARPPQQALSIRITRSRRFRIAACSGVRQRRWRDSSRCADASGARKGQVKAALVVILPLQRGAQTSRFGALVH